MNGFEIDDCIFLSTMFLYLLFPFAMLRFLSEKEVEGLEGWLSI